jgi:hypothetical protein
MISINCEHVILYENFNDGPIIGVEMYLIVLFNPILPQDSWGWETSLWATHAKIENVKKYEQAIFDKNFTLLNIHSDDVELKNLCEIRMKILKDVNNEDIKVEKINFEPLMTKYQILKEQS